MPSIASLQAGDTFPAICEYDNSIDKIVLRTMHKSLEETIGWATRAGAERVIVEVRVVGRVIPQPGLFTRE